MKGRTPRGTPPGRKDDSAGRAGRESKAFLLLGSVFVFACACAAYWVSFHATFLNWDDQVYVLKNPWIRGLTWSNLQAIFARPYFQNYLPLHLLSYAFDYTLWGLKPAGYHATSIVLHALNAVLCMFVALRLGGSRAVAFLTALFFAVHPSHVESVAWVSSRKDVLSTTFLLLSLLAYLSARKGKGLRPLPYAVSVLCFLLGMLSKVSIVVLPGFLLLLDFVRDPKREGAHRPTLLQAIASKIPYALIGGILVLVNSRAQVTAQAPYAHEPLRYLAVKGHAIWNYLAVLFGFGGNPDYDLPKSAPAPLDFAGLLVLPVLAVVLLRARRRLEFLGVSWVFILLLPALAFPLVTYMADRYLYAPSLGFCWAAASALASVGAWERERRTPRSMAAALAALCLVVFFAVRTVRYSQVWKDSESLWTFAITKSEDFRVFNNLAEVRVAQKRWEEAERLLKRGAEVENVISYQGLGVLYYNQRRLDEALRATDRALEIQARKRPDPALAAELHFNRGSILWLQGQSASAQEEWRTALRLDPTHAQAREWLGIAAPSR